MTTNKRWFDTGCLKAKPKGVDHAASIIQGVKVCSEGEAKGHGFSVDAEFIDAVAAQGAAAKKGLKSRFGHPNMCSEALGTFLGRFKNFTTGTTVRDDGTVAACCFADLHLSETAKKAPAGDLHSYVMEMAAAEGDVFGTSIVFKQGAQYRRNSAGDKVFPYTDDGERNGEYHDTDGPDFVECGALLACDCVDDPAANDGMFSAFSDGSMAAKITEFLDLHPGVFSLLTESPEVLEAIAHHGDKFDEFLTRYKEHRTGQVISGDETTQHKEATMPEHHEEVAEVVETDEQLQDAPELQEEQAPETAELSTEEIVEAALQNDRRRQAEIRELGSKFGFTIAAEQFSKDGKSVEDFRKHILSRSPEDWIESLSIKNPAQQQSEADIESYSAGDEAVAAIKQRRAAK